MVASEAVPFAKTGGLADVVAALPKALGALGHDVTVVIPRYRGIAVSGAPTTSFPVSMGGHDYPGRRVHPRNEPGRTRGAGRSPGVLRPRRALRAGQPRLRRQPSPIRVPVPGGPGVGTTRGQARRHRPRARLAGWTRPGLREDPVCQRSRARWRGDGVHHPQHRVPGELLVRVVATARARVGRLHERRTRVLAACQPAQGRHHVRGPGDHGEPPVRAGADDAGVLLRVRGHPSSSRRRSRGHPQRHRRRRVGSGDATLTCPRATARRTCRASSTRSGRCSRRTVSRSATTWPAAR